MTQFGNPGSDWYNINYDSSGWSSHSTGCLGKWQQNTLYVLHDFQIEDRDFVRAVDFFMFYEDGVVVYLNKELLFTRNMPEEFHHNSQAIRQIPFGNYSISVPLSLLRSGKNVLAIEYHKHANSRDIFWDMQFRVYTSLCVSRLNQGVITDSLGYTPNHSDSIWNDYSSSQWVTYSYPAWTQWSYRHDHSEYVNKLVIGSATNVHHPSMIQVFGSNDKARWTPLLTVENSTLFDTNSQCEFTMKSHVDAFTHYKVELTQSVNGGTPVGLSIIDLQYCQPTFCLTQDGFPGSYPNETQYINCPTGMIGESSRTCQEGDPVPRWSIPNQDCRKLICDSGISYVDFALQFENITLVELVEKQTQSLPTLIQQTLNVGMVEDVDVWRIRELDTIPQAVRMFIRVSISFGPEDVFNYLNENKAFFLEQVKGIFSASMFTVVFYVDPILSEAIIPNPSIRPQWIRWISYTFVGFLFLFVLIVLCNWIRAYIQKQKRRMPVVYAI